MRDDTSGRPLHTLFIDLKRETELKGSIRKSGRAGCPHPAGETHRNWRVIRESPLQYKEWNQIEIFTIPVGNAVPGVPIKLPQTYNYEF